MEFFFFFFVVVDMRPFIFFCTFPLLILLPFPPHKSVFLIIYINSLPSLCARIFLKLHIRLFNFFVLYFFQPFPNPYLYIPIPFHLDPYTTILFFLPPSNPSNFFFYPSFVYIHPSFSPNLSIPLILFLLLAFYSFVGYNIHSKLTLHMHYIQFKTIETKHLLWNVVFMDYAG